MMNSLKSIIRNFYQKTPWLFRIDAFFTQRMQGVQSAENQCDGNQETDRYDIQNLGELLQFLDHTEAKVYGREIIEGYEEHADQSVLLVSHELSFSGAPIVLLRLAESLKRRGFQTVIICGRDGEIFADHATRMGIPVVCYPGLLESGMVFCIRKLFSRIIVNTIRCASVINQLNDTDSSVMWWIHEAGACYQRSTAREMPYQVTENIHIYSCGSYAGKMLVSRFPRYSVKNLTAGVPDLAKADNKSDFHLDLPDKKIFALFGAVEYRKGQDVLKNAIKRLPERIRKECFFLFVGRDSDPKITSALRELNYQYPENVLYIDEIKYNDMCRLYRDIHFLVCASRDDPTPLVVAESMSLGKPCICSEHTGAAAVIEKYNAGYVYRHNSAPALAQRIEEAYYLNIENYETMSKNARSAFEQVFSEELFEEKLDQCLEKMKND